MTIRYLSFAFEGCLFNKNYWKELTKSPKSIAKAVKIANQGLFKQLKEEGLDFSTTTVLIASTLMNFQSAYCPAARIISTVLHAQLDPFLMADIAEGREPGESFYRIIKNLDNNNSNKHQTVLVNLYDSIIPLLFAQMYKAAFDNPNQEILFEVWSGSREDIDAIEKTFTMYKNFIPSDVRLIIRLYDGRLYDLKIELDSDKSIVSLPDYLRLAAIMSTNLERLDLVSNDLTNFAQGVSSTIYPPVYTLPLSEKASQDEVEEEEISSTLFFKKKPLVTPHSLPATEITRLNNPAYVIGQRIHYRDHTIFPITFLKQDQLLHFRFGKNNNLFVLEKEQWRELALLNGNYIQSLEKYLADQNSSNNPIHWQWAVLRPSLTAAAAQEKPTDVPPPAPQNM